MNISKILEQDSKEVSNKEKIQQVSEVVSAARESYGNTKADIESPMINTTEGSVKLEFVTDETKLVLIAKEVAAIKTAAIEASEDVEGVNMNKVVESLISTSPLLVNISESTSFDYI